METTVVGTKYVGLVTGACLAEIAARREQPTRQPPRLHDRRRLCISLGLLQFIAVGTSPEEDGSGDLRHVLAAARAIGERMMEYKVILDKLAAYDPVAMAKARKVHVSEPRIGFAECALGACDGAVALIIVTEREEFRRAAFAEVKTRLKTPLIVDGRNLHEPGVPRGVALEHVAIGSNGITATATPNP